jgi:starch synthase
MMAMKYGAVPIVHKTGGLADTVIDFDQSPSNANEFSFEAYTTAAVKERVERALRIYHHEPAVWQKLMLRGMRGDFSWGRSADLYISLYRRALDNVWGQHLN